MRLLPQRETEQFGRDKSTALLSKRRTSNNDDDANGSVQKMDPPPSFVDHIGFLWGPGLWRVHILNPYYSLDILKRRQISEVHLGDDNGLCNGLPSSLPEWSAIRCCRKLTRDWKKRWHCSHLNFPSDSSWWFARLKWYFSPQRDLKSWLQPCTGHITVPFCASCSFSSTKFTLIGRSSESAASDITRTGQSRNVWEQK